MHPMKSWFRRENKSPASGGEHPGQPTGVLNQLLTGGLLVTLGLVLAGALAAFVGFVMRWIDPSTQIILAGVSNPATLKPEDANAFGKEVTDIFSDDINQVIQTGRSYVGTRNASSKSRAAQPFDPVPAIPISRSYGIEIKGISVDQIISIWKSIRYNQVTVSGDILPAKNSPDHFVLYVSWRSAHSTYHWTSGEFDATDVSLESSLQNSALHFVKEINPEIAGRYYLSERDFADAFSTFSDWMSLEPSRPEPYLYLAKTLDLQGDYLRAVPFADIAERLLAGAPGSTRGRVRVGIYLVRSLSFFESKNVGSFDSFVERYLPNDPNALTNLGLRYLELGQLKNAEGELKDALKKDPNDYGAIVLLGETFATENDSVNAAHYFQKALELQPQSAPAATGYVAALYKSTKYKDASEYCASWVYPNDGQAGVVADPNANDLYFDCAESERNLPTPELSALRWYYIETLTRDESNEGETESNIAKPQTLMTMHDVLCNIEEVDIPKGQAPSEWIGGIDSLALRLKKQSTVDRTLILDARGCTDAATRLKANEKTSGPTTGEGRTTFKPAVPAAAKPSHPK